MVVMDKNKFFQDFYETMKNTNFDLTTFKNNIKTLKITHNEN